MKFCNYSNFDALFFSSVMIDFPFLENQASALLIFFQRTIFVSCIFTEGDPEKFTVGVLDSPLRIALPFQVGCFFISLVIIRVGLLKSSLRA